MIDLADYPLTLIFAVSLIVILAGSEIGRRHGLRIAGRGGDDVSTLEGALLGLMALLIGFTFSMALARFEARRDALLADANAIGTTALRARLLPQPYRAECLKLLREYTQLRLDVSRNGVSSPEFAAALARSNAIQEALWRQARAVAAKDNAMVPTGIFIQTLNEMIDNHEKRLTALYNRVPPIVLWALYGIAIISSTFTGYACALETRRSRLPVYVMGIVVAAVILLVQDLDRPTGFIAVNQQPMIDVAAGLASHAD